MERVSNSRYTREFHEEAVKLVTAGGISVYERTHEERFEKPDRFPIL